MPIVGFTCPACHRKVPLDHYAQANACSAKIHPDYVAAVIADRELQEDRAGVRVSMGLGCPRKYAIAAVEDIHPDPLAFNSMLGGTAWHAMMEKGCADQGFVGSEIEVAGNIAGVDLTGKIDRVRYIGDQLRIEDWKTGNDFRVKYLKPSPKSPDAGGPIEYKVQVSLYADLYRQQFNRQPDIGAINWRFSSDMWVEEFALLPLDQCLAHSPNGCEFTIAELLQQAKAFVEGQPWRELPMVGQSIKFGAKTGCDYCVVKDVCWTAATGAPF